MSTDPVAFEAWMTLEFGPPPPVYCQVYEDGHEAWSGVHTDEEAREVAAVRASRPGFRGVISFERTRS